MKKLVVVVAMVMSLLTGVCDAATDKNATQEELKPMFGVWLCGVWQDTVSLETTEFTYRDMEDLNHIEYANEPGKFICHATFVHEGETFGIYIKRGYGNVVRMHIICSTADGDTLYKEFVKIEG